MSGETGWPDSRLFAVLDWARESKPSQKDILGGLKRMKTLVLTNALRKIQANKFPYDRTLTWDDEFIDSVLSRFVTVSV